jgi:predicted transcriptional regulator
MATMSVRIPDEQERALRALAVAVDTSVSALVRAAVAECIDRHRAERASQRRLGRVSERGWEVFDLVTR